MVKLETNQQIISLLFDLARESIKVKNIIINQKDQVFRMRPTINLYLEAPFGISKSTILKDLSQTTKAPLYTGITYPSLVGSVDKNGNIISGAVWDSKNNFLLLDEFYTNKQNQVLDCLLQLFEGGYYHRRVARFSGRDLKKTSGDLYMRFSKEGDIEIKTRFSGIITTMHNTTGKRVGVGMSALLSRCIPYYFKPTDDELFNILEGKPFYRPQRFKKTRVQDIEIDNPEWMKLLSVVRKKVKEHKLPINYIMRISGEIMRVQSIMKDVPEELIDLIFRLYKMKGRL